MSEIAKFIDANILYFVVFFVGVLVGIILCFLNIKDRLQ